MKRLFIVFAFLLATVVNAQFMVNPFETAAADSFFNHPEPGNLHGLGTGQGYVILSDTNDAHQGQKSLKVMWHCNTTESWGGFNQLMYLIPITEHRYLDFSMADHLSIWYKTIRPSTAPGFVHMRFKLHEAGGGADYWNSQNDHEDWYFETAVPYDDSTGQWQELIIPLKTINGFDGAPPTDEGFSLPGWSGARNNGELDLDKIVGYSIEVTAPQVGGDQWAYGTTLWDDLRLMGSKYEPIATFDNVAADPNYFTFDKMEWANANAALDLTDVTTDVFQGASSLQIHYKVNANQDWGGYVNMTHKFDTPRNLASNTALYCAIKNLVPNNLPTRLQCRFILFDGSGNGEESWFQLLNFNIDSTYNEWTTVKIPLEYISDQTWDLQKGVFINPPGQGNDDGKMDLTTITGFKIEFSVNGSDKGSVGADVISEGTMMIDFIIPAGYQETDKTPPDAPQGVTAIAGNYSNLIIWNDVPGESQEKYNVYFSTQPITDVNAPGVNAVKVKIPEGVSQVEHLLRSPVRDTTLTYYYAVTCTDKAGNVSVVSENSSATNTAKGVPVISLNPPANFNPDGDLSEWSGIQPIEIAISKGTGFPAPNTFVTDDADCSAKAYLAIDNQYLYVAFDVDDDIVNPSSQAASYLNDSPDLFIGLYNMSGVPHSAYQRGKQPDYHIRFNIGAVRSEGGADIDTVMKPGPNYFWGEKFPSGYTVEAKISLDDLMNKRNSPDARKDTIYVKKGFRVPIDFSINDNDTGDRDGILCYSPYNQDQSWADASRWLWTWIGDAMEPVTSVKNESVPVQYSLEQNYPNPFNPTTQIKYSIARPGLVTLRVYDILGRLVKELVNQNQEAGQYTINFNASGLASGIYLYKLESGSFTSVKKLMLIK
ncbi:sugar-binding protein [Melioribacteraceae bacterium 4301-Me]|uniref:T9SS type A sorting domain-containing protein n=1 Tax=Pyranulibacter aquaticus TaxID=3163344 RepID=UPI003598FE33